RHFGRDRRSRGCPHSTVLAPANSSKVPRPTGSTRHISAESPNGPPRGVSRRSRIDAGYHSRAFTTLPDLGVPIVVPKPRPTGTHIDMNLDDVVVDAYSLEQARAKREISRLVLGQAFDAEIRRGLCQHVCAARGGARGGEP